MKELTEKQKEKQRAYAREYWQRMKNSMTPEEYTEYNKKKMMLAQKRLLNATEEQKQRRKKASLAYYYRVVKPRMEVDPEFRKERQAVWSGSIERRRKTLSPEDFEKFMANKRKKEKERRDRPEIKKRMKEMLRLRWEQQRVASRAPYEKAYRNLHKDERESTYSCEHHTFTILNSDTIALTFEGVKEKYRILHQCAQVTVQKRHSRNHRIYCFHETSPDDLGLRRGQEGESENPSAGPVRYEGRGARKG